MRWQSISALVLASNLCFTAYGRTGFNLFSAECNEEKRDSIEGAPQSPPLGLDDPGTAGCNNWEINLLVDGDVTKDRSSWDAPLLDMNYGIGDNLQVKLEVPRLLEHKSGKNTNALGDSNTGIKYQFYAQEDGDLELAIYPQIQFASIGSKAEDKGIESSGSILSLPIILGATLGKTTYGDVKFGMNVRLSHSRKEDVQDSTSASAGIGLPVSTKVALMSEVSLERANKESADGLRDESSALTIGGIAQVCEHFMLLASIGHTLKSSDHLQHLYPLLGIRWAP